jgi:hypothetical protein
MLKGKFYVRRTPNQFDVISECDEDTLSVAGIPDEKLAEMLCEQINRWVTNRGKQGRALGTHLPLITRTERVEWPIGAAVWVPMGARGWIPAKVTGYTKRYVLTRVVAAQDLFTQERRSCVPTKLRLRTDAHPPEENAY